MSSSAIIIEANCVESLHTRIIKHDSYQKGGDYRPAFGFLIGHQLAQVDYVIHLARWSNKFCATYTADEHTEQKHRAIDLEPAIDLLDEESVLLHARQILRMLPGGSDIIGLFAFGHKKELLESQAFLTKVSRRLCELRFDLSNFDKIRLSENRINRFLLLNRDSSSNKTTVTVIDCNSLSGRSAPTLSSISSTVPFSERRMQYVTINCALNFDLRSFTSTSIPSSKINVDTVNLTSQSQDFESQCYNVLRPFFEHLQDAFITFNRTLREDYENVDEPDMSSIEGRILLPTSSKNDVTAIKQQNCSSKMHLKGNAVCKVQLPSKCTYGEAAFALKQDLARGLKARIQLHAEGANVVEGEELAVEAFHRLPRRVFLSLLEHQPQQQTNRRGATRGKQQSSCSAYSSPLLACDYLFEAETTKDGAKNFADVFDLEVEEDQLNLLAEKISDQLELVPDECKLLTGDALDFSYRVGGSDQYHRANSLTGGVSSSSMESVEQLIEMENKMQLNSWTFFYIAIGILIGLLACLLYFLLNN